MNLKVSLWKRLSKIWVLVCFVEDSVIGILSNGIK